MTDSSASITLGYWKIRGLAQPIRFLLEYANLKYDETLYQAGGAPDFDRSQWTSKKEHLGLAFPNLPYVVHGDLKLTESRAILVYFGKLAQLNGATLQDEARHDMLLNYLGDFARTLGSISYNPDFAHLLVSVRQNDIPNVFGRITSFLGQRSFLVNADKPSPADFVLYEHLCVAQAMVPDCLAPFPTLEQFKHRIEALPAIAAYMRSDRYLAKPINNTMAFFGNK